MAETVVLEIEMGNDLIAKTHELAIRCFGDDSDESLARVLEVALSMRYFWSKSVKEGQRETDEAISMWECPESATKEENSSSIQRWLFRR